MMSGNVCATNSVLTTVPMLLCVAMCCFVLLCVAPMCCFNYTATYKIL